MVTEPQEHHRCPRTDLPRLLVLTDRRQAATAGRSLAATVAAIVTVAPVAVVFREKDLGVDERRALGAEVAAVAHESGAPLIVASDAALAAELGALGVHLAVADERGE